MAGYEVILHERVPGDLRDAPAAVLGRVAERIAGLAEEPRPVQARRLSHAEKYRVREGDRRIVYSVDDAARTVVVRAVVKGRRAPADPDDPAAYFL